jgi:hypothetical protein
VPTQRPPTRWHPRPAVRAHPGGYPDALDCRHGTPRAPPAAPPDHPAASRGSRSVPAGRPAHHPAWGRAQGARPLDCPAAPGCGRRRRGRRRAGPLGLRDPEGPLWRAGPLGLRDREGPLFPWGLTRWRGPRGPPPVRRRTSRRWARVVDEAVPGRVRRTRRNDRPRDGGRRATPAPPPVPVRWRPTEAPGQPALPCAPPAPSRALRRPPPGPDRPVSSDPARLLLLGPGPPSPQDPGRPSAPGPAGPRGAGRWRAEVPPDPSGPFRGRARAGSVPPRRVEPGRTREGCLPEAEASPGARPGRRWAVTTPPAAGSRWGARPTTRRSGEGADRSQWRRGRVAGPARATRVVPGDRGRGALARGWGRSFGPRKLPRAAPRTGVGPSLSGRGRFRDSRPAAWGGPIPPTAAEG